MKPGRKILILVRLYLYQTARNELIDYYREQNGFGASRFTGEEQLVWKVDDLKVFKEKPEKIGKLKETYDLLQHTLSNFDWKKRLIYLTYLDADVKEGEMQPRHLSKLLREATGLGQQSIRKYNVLIFFRKGKRGMGGQEFESSASKKIFYK